VEHLQHFGLNQDPFSNEPDQRFYFDSTSACDAQRRVERGLRQHKGLTLLTGDGGMGKTLLARRILEGLEEEIFEATLLVMLRGAADATGILQRFARQLGEEEPADDRAGLLAQIYEQLAIVREDGRHAVLMIDDAQIMTPGVFAELGGLLNLEYEDRRLVSILFVGNPELDSLVENDPCMAPRVDVRVRLMPLDLPNATAYLEHRLAAVSGSPSIVPPVAIETLCKFGRGRPRLINTLADNALFEAYLGGRKAIEAGDVERAAADLGIGPDPGSTFTNIEATAPTASPTPAAPIASPVVDTLDVVDEAVLAAPMLDEPMLEPILEFTPTEALEMTSEPVSDIPDFELTPEMATETVDASVETDDLDLSFTAAFEDFDNVAPTAAAVATDALGTNELTLDEAPLDAAMAPIEDAVPASLVESESEPEELVLADTDYAPLEPGEGDQFDDLFAELIEE
jgi:general secretion pathway protein A